MPQCRASDASQRHRQTAVEANRRNNYLSLSSSWWHDVLHLQVVVSRKTPFDGRLEIPESLAQRLLTSNAPLMLSIPGAQADMRVEEMPCTCAKGAGGNHIHHFLAADALKSLPAGANVNLVVDVDEGSVRIELPT
jgi:hypothetical protein